MGSGDIEVVFTGNVIGDLELEEVSGFVTCSTTVSGG
jgi:hypothetical protein